jgi:chaperonin GroEL
MNNQPRKIYLNSGGNIEALLALKKGVDLAADTIKSTLGPGGRTVFYPRNLWAPPLSTKDGVTVAKQIQLEDPVENMGAQIVLEASNRTNAAAGDGTTQAAVFVQAILGEGIRSITAGANPTDLRRGIEAATKTVVEKLAEHSIECTNELLAGAATTSANGDREIGEMVRDAVVHVGADGIITVEDNRKPVTELYKAEGMSFDRGWFSQMFVNFGTDMSARYSEPYIFITDQAFQAFEQFNPVLKLILGPPKTGVNPQDQEAKFEDMKLRCANAKPLIVICENLYGDALRAAMELRQQAGLKVVFIKCPGYAERRKALLEDIAAATGGVAFIGEEGKRPENVKYSDLGTCASIRVTQFETVITRKKDEKLDALVKERVEMVRTMLSQATNDYDEERLRERLAMLQSGVAALRIGARTEIELREKKDRYDDAVCAARAARKEGVIPGGGSTLLVIAEGLLKAEYDKKAAGNEDFRTGIRILLAACKAPFKQILVNAGIGEKAGVIAERIWLGRSSENKQDGFGFNVARGDAGEYEDLFASGIADPAKAIRLALENAVSVATQLLTTGAVISEILSADVLAAASHLKSKAEMHGI